MMKDVNFGSLNTAINYNEERIKIEIIPEISKIQEKKVFENSFIKKINYYK